MNNNTYRSQHIITFAAIVFLFAACTKDNDSPNDPLTPAQNKSLIYLTDASPYTNSIDLRLNDSLMLGEYFRRGSEKYFSVADGTVNVKVSQLGTTNYIVDTNINNIATGRYSVFVVNNWNKLSVIAVQDNFPNLDAGRAGIRFMNLSPDAPNLDVYIKETGQLLFSNRGYCDEESPTSNQIFIPFPIGTYTLQIRQAGTGNILLEMGNVQFYSQKIYNIWAGGNMSDTGATAFCLNLQTLM
jgi:hypothetical protein